MRPFIPENASFVYLHCCGFVFSARARAPALQSWAPTALVHHRVSASILARAAVLFAAVLLMVPLISRTFVLKI